MLELIRKNAQGIIIWIIVGFVILGLSSFILSSYIADNIKNYVAKVNDNEISNRDFQIAYNNYQQQLQQSLGENYTRFFNEDFMRETVITGLVNNALISQLVVDAGFRAGGDQVYAELVNNPNFKDEAGGFSVSRYEKLLQQIGYSKAAYEAEVAQLIAQQQLTSGIQQSAFVLEQNAKNLLLLEQQQRDISYLNISKASLLKNIEVTEEEITSYYEQNKKNYMTEEQVKLAYLEVNITDIAKSIEIDAEELRNHYNNNKAAYIKDDFVSAEKRIKEIQARIKKGEAFAKLASEYSQDPGSAANGGDLGFFGKGVMAAEFDEATFKLNVGEVSKPVKTQFGYHLIKLEEARDNERRARHILIKPEKVTPAFEIVKARILNDMQMTRAEKRFYENADKLDRLAYQFQDSLEPAAEQIGLKIKESPYITRAGGGQIWRNANVLRAAFSEAVLNEGLNSELIKLSDDHMLVIRLKDFKPATQKSLDAVRAQIKATVKDNKAREKADKLADGLIEKLNNQNAGEIADSDEAVTLRKVGFIGRTVKNDDKNDNSSLPPELRKAVFSMPKPVGDKPSIDKIALGTGNVAVVLLRSIKQGSEDNQQLDAVERHLIDAKAKADNKALLEYMRSHSKIDYNKQDNNQE